jgi:hypothetical protein
MTTFTKLIEWLGKAFGMKAAPSQAEEPAPTDAPPPEESGTPASSGQ